MTDGVVGASAGVERSADRSAAALGIADRLWGAAWAAGTLALLVVAAGLEPAEAGQGTHQQLGLPGCVWLAVFDAPCPTCGMTTAFAHAAHGSYLQAAIAQPLGAALAVGAAAVFWLALHTATTGSRVLGLAGRAAAPWGVWLGLAALFASWAYKLIQHAG